MYISRVKSLFQITGPLKPIKCNHYYYCYCNKLCQSNESVIHNRKCSSQYTSQQYKHESRDNEFELKSRDDALNYKESDNRNDNLNITRGVPKTVEEYRLRKRLQIVQPEIPRLTRVAILGVPNAGKSTLTNCLVGMKISSVSKKVHTTRHKVTAVYVDDDVQIEFLDTPGIVTQSHCHKHSLEPTFMSDPPSSVSDADIIAVVSDCSNMRDKQRINPGILNLLSQYTDKDSILILNKIDLIKAKRKLLDLSTQLTCGIVGGIRSVEIKKYEYPKDNRRISLETVLKRAEQKLKLNINETDKSHDDNDVIGWPHFSRVFMVSSLTGDGVEDIRNYFIENSRFKPWIYHPSQVTDQKPTDIVKSTIKEKCLDLLPQEIPYNINFGIHMWELDRAGNMHLIINLYCPERFQSMIIGPKGDTIAKIVDRAKLGLQNTFHCDVSLKIAVKGVKSITKN